MVCQSSFAAYAIIEHMKRTQGFTIVELLIVIVIIGILATIAGVAYSGIAKRAQTASLQSDLTSAAKQMELAFSREGKGAAFPTTLPSDVSTSSGNVLQLANTGNPKEFCINGYSTNDYIRLSIDSSTGKIRQHLCSGYMIGSPVGGAVPQAPPNTNLAGDLSTWSTSSAVSYDSTTNELRLNDSVSGNSASPLIRIDGSTQARLSIESYATKPSPTSDPESQVYFGSRYYDASGNSIQNTSGYTGNGNAQALPLNQWKSFSWITPTGPDVMYVQFIVHSSPTNRTSDNRFRNVSIEAI